MSALARVSPWLHQVFEQRELARGQRDRATAAVTRRATWSSDDRPDHQRLGTPAVSSAQQRVDPRAEDRALEGFAQEVIGPHLEPLDLVELAVLGREHEQRGLHARGAQVVADVEAVALGQHDVEHDDVELVVEAREEPALAVVALHDVKALVPQEVGDGPRQVDVVLDDEHSSAFVTHFR